MNENMWNIQLEYSTTPTSTPPNEIVQTQCEHLKKITQGRIIAKISSYFGPVSSYTVPSLGQVLATLAEKVSLAGTDKTVDIQEDLGDIGESPNRFFTFEFFITSIATPNYKYRIMFLRYEIGYYPLAIVLDDEIAIDINENQTIICENEKSFNDMLEKIINSAKVKKVILNLYAIAIREEERKSRIVSLNSEG